MIIDIPKMIAFLRGHGITADTPREVIRAGVIFVIGPRVSVYIPALDWPAVREGLSNV